MLRRLSLVSIVALLVLPAMARAEFRQGDFALTLSANGAASRDFDTGSINVGLGVDWFFTDQISFGANQLFNWSDGGSVWAGFTSVSADWNFDLGEWVPYVGVALGYQYGEGANDSWIFGPEAGVRYFVNSTTFIEAFLGYNFDLEESFSDGSWVYGAGIGFKF